MTGDASKTKAVQAPSAVLSVPIRKPAVFPTLMSCGRGEAGGGATTQGLCSRREVQPVAYEIAYKAAVCGLM